MSRNNDEPELAPLNVNSPQPSSPETRRKSPVFIQMSEQGQNQTQSQDMVKPTVIQTQMMQPTMIGGPQLMPMQGPGITQPTRVHPMMGPGGPGGPGQQFVPYGANMQGHPMRPAQYPPQHLQQGYRPQPMGPGYGQNYGNQNVSRFQGDNRGIQGMQDQNGPSTYEGCQVCTAQCSSWCGTWCSCLPCFTNPYQRVPEGFSGIIVRFGKFYKLIGPGMHYLLPDLDTLSFVDKREKVFELNKQNVVTIDNATLLIDAVLYYKIINSYKSKFAVANLAESIQDLAITTLRNIIGKMSVQQFLQEQDHLADKIEEEISHIASTWGVKVMRLLVQDVSLPPQFRNTFSTGAVAKRISEAQVIHSQAEVQVAKLLKEASDALNTDAAFQIRYIDALENIAKSSNPKMIFFPADYRDVGTANGELI